ncbi:MAG: mitochondrial import inner membrane translocase subunit tim54 [Geoglossum simile]|nr:MAG: mitochondrial import inner membrane translocase subunit tim54 [Geoglossum simile]
MGIPNMKLKLPSRNWLIFLSLTGSFTTAVLYDRHAKKKIQQKWCNLVSHLADEALDTAAMPRKVTIFLSAPPGDGLSPAREHFREYVKPLLVAAAIDWDVIEGRKEGDVQRGLAEKLRWTRRRSGEGDRGVVENDEKERQRAALAEYRRTRGIPDIQEFNGMRGDIILGRHTWKEYVRGLHEGWLGPVDPTLPPPPESAPLDPVTTEFAQSGTTTQEPQIDEPESSTVTSPLDPPSPLESPKPNPDTLHFISPSQYPDSPTPPSIPPSFSPSTPIPFPHVLGFLNTPTRLYRFLTRRYLADAIGRQVSSIVLAPGVQRWDTERSTSESDSGELVETAGSGPIRAALEQEEVDWRKDVRRRDKDQEGQERVWLDDLVLDPRIAGRMTRFVALPREEEERAERIANGTEGPRVLEKPADRDGLR